MRPTVTEQIDGVRRVLEELVIPQLDNPFIKDQITHAAGVLVHAADRWSRVLPDLVADIRALEEVLGVEPRVLAEAVPGVADLDAAEEYHRGLRARLSDEIMAAPEPSPAIRTYLADSIDRLK